MNASRHAPYYSGRVDVSQRMATHEDRDNPGEYYSEVYDRVTRGTRIHTTANFPTFAEAVAAAVEWDRDRESRPEDET